MKLSLLPVLALTSAVLAVPIPVAEPEASPGYGKYASYGAYAPPAGGYKSYGKYASYGTYKRLEDKIEKRDAANYANYGDYPPPAGGYGEYGSYASVTPPAPVPVPEPVPAPAGGYGSYPPPPGGYGSYGAYKRAIVDWVKTIWN